LRVPFFAWLWVLKKLANLFNQLFQRGDQGAAQVVSPEEHADLLDKELLNKFDEVFEVKRLADQALVSPVGRSSLRSTPGLWERIRKLVFGFMDGSNLSQFGVSKSENGWPVFYRVTSSFPDPSDKIKPELDGFSSEKEFGWGSTIETQEYVAALLQKQSDSKGEMQAHLAQVVESQEGIRELEQLLKLHYPNLLPSESSKEDIELPLATTPSDAEGEIK
jgi:hypothetical protein